jgi:hypothetical protein
LRDGPCTPPNQVDDVELPGLPDGPGGWQAQRDRCAGRTADHADNLRVG